MIFRQLFDSESSTYTYLVADPETRLAALVDPVREQIERDLGLLAELNLKLAYVLDTHVHADHVTAAGLLRQRTGAKTVGGEKAAPCVDVQVKHGDVVALGGLQIKVLATPGHTDDSVSYLVQDALFSGDALLVRGTGRTDFQNGDAHALYHSITQVLFALPDTTRVYPGHDYRGNSESTIGEEKRFNPRVANKDEAQFVEVMKALQLPPPKKLQEAVPANQACGVPTPSFKDVTPNDAVAMSSQVRLVDVREQDEWIGELGHMPGAELVPLATLPQAAAGWDHKAPVMVVCRSGGRSSRAASWLVSNGFSSVMNMAGGMLEYNAAGLPAVRR